MTERHRNRQHNRKVRKHRERRERFGEHTDYEVPAEEQRIAHLVKVIKTDAGADFKGTPL
jgi:hypothetical protein